jgi:hypothetical protein
MAVAIELLAEVRPTSGMPEIGDGWRGLLDFGEAWTEGDAELWPAGSRDIPVGEPLVYGCELKRDADDTRRVRLHLFAVDEPREVMKPGTPFTLRDGQTARAAGHIV